MNGVGTFQNMWLQERDCGWKKNVQPFYFSVTWSVVEGFRFRQSACMSAQYQIFIGNSKVTHFPQAHKTKMYCKNRFAAKYYYWHISCGGPLLLIWFDFDPSTWISEYIHYKVCDKLSIHSQTSTELPEFGNGLVSSYHTLLGMWQLIHAGFKVNP